MLRVRQLAGRLSPNLCEDSQVSTLLIDTGEGGQNFCEDMKKREKDAGLRGQVRRQDAVVVSAKCCLGAHEPPAAKYGS